MWIPNSLSGKCLWLVQISYIAPNQSKSVIWLMNGENNGGMVALRRWLKVPEEMLISVCWIVCSGQSNNGKKLMQLRFSSILKEAPEQDIVLFLAYWPLFWRASNHIFMGKQSH